MRTVSDGRRSRLSGVRLVLAALSTAWIGAGLAAVLVVPRSEGVPRPAREAALRTNLDTMCDAIDQYHADRGAHPPSLEALVGHGYLRFVPIDPITKSSATWIVEPVPEGAGIAGVRSGAGAPGATAFRCRGTDG